MKIGEEMEQPTQEVTKDSASENIENVVENTSNNERIKNLRSALEDARREEFDMRKLEKKIINEDLIDNILNEILDLERKIRKEQAHLDELEEKHGEYVDAPKLRKKALIDIGVIKDEIEELGGDPDV